MIISLNGLIINDPSTGNGLYLDEPVEGLSLPPIRTSSGNYSGRDGGWVGAQFYGGRLINLTGRIFAASTAALEAGRQAFEAALAQPTVSVLITTNGGSQYALTAYFDSMSMPIERSAVQANWQITLLAPDPIIYDNSAGGGNTATISRTSGGGLSWKLTWPLMWAAGSSPTTVTNAGTVTIFPIVTLNGQMSAPIVTNQTTGQFISLPTLNTSAGDALVIDMLNRTVLLNGSSVLQYVSSTSTWWPLVVGSNSISLTTGNSADTVTGTVSWRSGYRGI